MFLSFYTYLKNCRYQVMAHFEWNENRPELAGDRNENKHHNIAKRMIEKGGRRDIFLGTRECQGYVVPCKFGEGEGHYDNIQELAFGLMYHGITYADEAFFRRNKKSLMLSHQTIEKPCLNSYQKSKIRNVAQVKCAVLSRKIDFCRKTRVLLT